MDNIIITPAGISINITAAEKMIDDGLATPSISKILGINPATVRPNLKKNLSQEYLAKLIKNGTKSSRMKSKTRLEDGYLKSGKKTIVSAEKLKDMIDRGKPVGDICLSVDISRKTIIKYVEDFFPEYSEKLKDNNKQAIHKSPWMRRTKRAI